MDKESKEICKLAILTTSTVSAAISAIAAWSIVCTVKNPDVFNVCCSTIITAFGILSYANVYKSIKTYKQLGNIR